MKKTIVCIFAHPDDEAFGPGGTIAKLSKDHDLYIICVTKGDAGKNSSDNKSDLGEIRRKEMLASTKILGVKEVFFFGYADGSLCNNLYHELAHKIQKKLQQLKPETVMTYDQNGISGHLDHIAVSLITTFVFNKNKSIKKLLYYCISKAGQEPMADYFIYFPQGRDPLEVDETIDISDVWETKVKAMHCHKSQIHDVKRILHNRKHLPKEEYFMVKTH